MIKTFQYKSLFVFGVICCFIVFTACESKSTINDSQEIAGIQKVVNDWHKAAAETNFDAYFSAMTADAVFIGTDPTENWQCDSFKFFCKPYFNKGKAWNFTSVQRNIYLSSDKSMAWFDELLNTQMKICRGSGVLVKVNKEWKIKHYVLSMTIPNANTNEVVKLKTSFEDSLLLKLATPN